MRRFSTPYIHAAYIHFANFGFSSLLLVPPIRGSCTKGLSFPIAQFGVPIAKGGTKSPTSLAGLQSAQHDLYAGV
jgi:hypothetical protein